MKTPRSCLRHAVIAMLLAITPATVWAQDIISVSLNDFKPMAFEEDGEIMGFDVDLLNAIAEEIGTDMTFSLLNKPAEVLAAVDAGQARVGAGGISITENRMKEGSKFTVPYFDSGLSILALGSRNSGFFGTARALLSWGTVQAFGAMLAACLVFGVIFWILERGSAAISDDPRQGISEGAYLALACNTTIGFGDVTPRRWTGRVCVLFAWWIGAIPVGWMTAKMAATEGYRLESTTITGAGDLGGKRVIAEADNTSVQTLKELGASVVTVTDREEALQLLFTREAEVIVHDTPGILFLAKGEGAGRTVIVGNQFDEQYYGLVIRDDELRHRVNIALMALKRKGVYEKISRKWFGVGSSGG